MAMGEGLTQPDMVPGTGGHVYGKLEKFRKKRWKNGIIHLQLIGVLHPDQHSTATHSQ